MVALRAACDGEPGVDSKDRSGERVDHSPAETEPVRGLFDNGASIAAWQSSSPMRSRASLPSDGWSDIRHRHMKRLQFNGRKGLPSLGMATSHRNNLLDGSEC